MKYQNSSVFNRHYLGIVIRREGFQYGQKCIMQYVNDLLQQLHEIKFSFKYLEYYNILLAQVDSR